MSESQTDLDLQRQLQRIEEGIRSLGAPSRSGETKYLTLLLCKIKGSYYEMDEQARVQITSEHVASLRKFSREITHLVTTGFNGKYDQVLLVESDNLRTIYDAVEAFKLGQKGQHIEILDAVFGIKVENKSDFKMIGNR
jgi:hypothetical protein